MYKYLLLVLIACSQIACKEKVNADPKEVTAFYTTIQETFGANYEPQHLFLNKATEAVNKVGVDNNAVVDTKELRELLLNAKKACTERMRMVASLKEVDININYKNKVVKSIDVFSKACDKEFKEFIDLLDLKVENKLDKLTQIVQQTLYEIETTAKECEAAATELTTKYAIKK